MNKKNVFIILAAIIIIVGIVIVNNMLRERAEDANVNIGSDIEQFSRFFIKGSTRILKKTQDDILKNIETPLDNSWPQFNELFFIGHTKQGLNTALRIGTDLIERKPRNIELKRKVAFLCYLDGQYDKAIEYYKLVLKKYPKRRRTFKGLSKAKGFFTVKRALLELAAVYSDKNEFKEMQQFYRQYLKVSQREDIFKKLIEQESDELKIKLDIIYELAGEGIFSYKKAVELLKQLHRQYPLNNEIIYRLGVNSFEIINMFKAYDIKQDEEYIACAQQYLEQSLEGSYPDRKRTILLKLGQIYKIQEKYYKAAKTYKQALGLTAGSGSRQSEFNNGMEFLDLLKQAKMYDEALAQARKMLEGYGRDPFARQIKLKIDQVQAEKWDYIRASSFYQQQMLEKLRQQEDNIKE